MKGKRKNGLYEFLAKAGVLEHGSVADITLAKKKYWDLVRKEWRKQQRKEQKSYAIFFTPSEQKQVKMTADKKGKSITRFIKDSVLHTAYGGAGIDKTTVGNIREAFFICYHSIAEDEKIELVLQKLDALEQKVMKLIQ
jgi:hypothetical protein